SSVSVGSGPSWNRFTVELWDLTTLAFHALTSSTPRGMQPRPSFPIDQTPEHGPLAAVAARGVAPDVQAVELGLQSVGDQQATDEGFAEPNDQLSCLDGHQ